MSHPTRADLIKINNIHFELVAITKPDDNAVCGVQALWSCSFLVRLFTSRRYKDVEGGGIGLNRLVFREVPAF